MSDSGFPPTSSPETDYADRSNFDLSDFEFFDEPLEDDPASMVSGSSSIQISPASDIGNSSKSSSHQEEATSSSKTIGRGEAKLKKEDTAKVAFKTKSEFEILDDGFKWRKYGKKTVKNSPYPRNYYKCSVEGCPVKKRVEKDGEDPRYVITTYEGIHNHQAPSL